MIPAARLQQLAPDGLWAVADSNVLQAIARGEPAQFGKRGKRLRALTGAFASAGLVYPFMMFVGMRELVRLFVQQYYGTRPTSQRESNGDARSKPPPEYLFVGFGAGSEEPLYTQYLREHSHGVGRIDQTDARSLGTWHKVSLVMAGRALIVALNRAKVTLSSIPPEFGKWHLDFVTFAAIRIAHYAFMRVWFERLRASSGRLREVAFLAADTPAFAAVDAGLPTRYIQHGMVRHSIVLPHFARIAALTPDEATHFRQRLPTSKIGLQPLFAEPLQPGKTSRVILIASVYGIPSEMPRVASFIDWASSKPLRVSVRPHPCEDRAFWGGDAVRAAVTIEDGDSSLQETIARLRPRIVVSWFSTALADALALGVIPVSVSAKDDPNVADMVYPLFERCLSWPDDAPKVERLLDDDQYYSVVLAQLRSSWSEGSD